MICGDSEEMKDFKAKPEEAIVWNGIHPSDPSFWMVKKERFLYEA